MNNKQLIAGIIISASLLVMPVTFAQNADNNGQINLIPTIGQMRQESSITEVSPVKWQNLKLVVNGKEFEPTEAGVYWKDGTLMAPLRVIAETLGYEVNWNGEQGIVELMKGPQWITVKVGEDRYTFGKMAPRPLGKIPAEIINEKTYVPLEFFSEILKIKVVQAQNGAGTISIN